jgi:hypothetical protein
MNWNNVVEDCPLCDMEKKTKWYEETDKFVIAEKLMGGPFIVLKNHTENPDQDTIEEAHNLVSDTFGNHSFRVLMNIVENHWHAHIIKDGSSYNLIEE